MNRILITFISTGLLLSACSTNNPSLSLVTPLKAPATWQTYTNSKLGFSLEYPPVTVDLSNSSSICHVPVKVTDSGSQIIFAQEYRTNGKDCAKTLSFELKNPPETISMVGQFIINYAHATNTQEIEDFTKRLFGNGCTLGTEVIPNENDFTIYRIELDQKYKNKSMDEIADLCSAGLGGKYRFYYHPHTQTAVLYQVAEKIFQDPYVYFVDSQPLSEINFDTDEKLSASFKYINSKK